ncbi:hypothetical protein NVV93_02950 [Pseudomonas sp. LS44]|uniref:hypothetical protein n=1 Tax=Pseudomonas sp. LS44 TaxID=1357074 RepID=UPI00215B43A0|nr:hypothetical protein [Pseudomonas sp. LS44]UVE18378.1 hypothetical protein NVV93_02950 [Pseudomonas sp. LS44]
MEIFVSPLTPPHGQQAWQVHLDQHAVGFRSEAEARQFVATLEARLQAPHVLPEQPARQSG